MNSTHNTHEHSPQSPGIVVHMQHSHFVPRLFCNESTILYIPQIYNYYFECKLKYPRGESTSLRWSACCVFIPIPSVVSVQLIFELLSTRKDNPSWRALFIRLSSDCSYFSIKTHLHPPHPLCSTVFSAHQIH